MIDVVVHDGEGDQEQEAVAEGDLEYINISNTSCSTCTLNLYYLNNVN